MTPATSQQLMDTVAVVTAIIPLEAATIRTIGDEWVLRTSETTSSL